MIKIGNNLSEWSVYSCQPKTKKELKEIIEERISKEGNECDLNDIDTSLITDMSYLFANKLFNGNISEWNTSNVVNMIGMFYKSNFNGDISKWNVSNVRSMGDICSLKVSSTRTSVNGRSTNNATLDTCLMVVL